ncbi:MAG: hypothetical protein IKU10_07130 [Clostridia bacterium]|nr:hypothetical protein [Clostridia bacterium]
MKMSFEDLTKSQPCFFPGANSSNGFFNGFDWLYKPKNADRFFILKGGPGTGKSTLMKRIALAMHRLGQPCELYYCASDPNSLDAVRFPAIGAAVADGTAPHVLEPRYLGVSERIVNLGEFLDDRRLQTQKDALIPLYEQNKNLHQRASRYLAAAGRLLDDSFAADCEMIDMEKVEETAERFANQVLPTIGEDGSEIRRFLSGNTPKGIVFLEDTIPYYVNKIYAIDDEYSGASSVMLSVLRQIALQRGHKVISCFCALHPNRTIDHLIIPTADVAFCTTNGYLPITVDTERRIHASRFRNQVAYGRIKQRLRFNRRACEELLDGAAGLLLKAKELHDQLESYYISAMDFSGMEQLADKIVNDLSERI